MLPEGQDRGAVDAVALLEESRGTLESLDLPLDVPGAAEERVAIRAAVAQLDDYILPRYRRLEAPLLAVVGGSTGAGKSTLVNALAGYPATRAGAIRPTTRQPVLLHHPSDAAWFKDRRILPGLSRITRTPPHAAAEAHVGGAELTAEPAGSSLVLLADRSIPAGIAVLDAPDIDSISDDNRRLAGQLLAAADLWIFVTTANRYADAVPWALLLDAAQRDIEVAVVLDRVPADVELEVRTDLAGLLQRQGLAAAKLFVIHESALDGQGMLPAGAVDPIRAWLEELAADASSRADIARRTLAGAVRSLAHTVRAGAVAADDQYAASQRLRKIVESAYEAATVQALAATQDGTLLRGEVLARWQDFVGTGEFIRGIESGIGRLRDRIGAFFSGKPAPSVVVEAAIESGLQAVVVEAAAKGAEQSDAGWRVDPAGQGLLGGEDLSTPSAGFSAEVAREIRAWQADLLELIRSEGEDKRFTARMLSFGVNGLGVALMVVIFAATGGLTGLEIGVAGGTAVVGQKLLEAVFGEDAVRRLARKARSQLEERTRRLMHAEAERFLSRVPPQEQQEAEAFRSLAEKLHAVGATTETEAPE
ncbi:dynamin family protein [Arthrobacter sulfonylureivorans]|uniref:Dynamin family protein n=2 Tax=Arthrobacter sulfonylureivorans TaxID=2486855 RepID=A0ABY3WEF8_9MICC|nr:dynamin family protein [Arthrobacter sulfonylureivorans]UNK47583.1 dynamin family protein [Arthrobacter sulfonylureivorans]